MTSCIRRRDFIALLGSSVLALPTTARAQQPRRVGVLLTAGPEDQENRINVAAFEQVVRALGWKVGQDIHIDYRWSAGSAERLQSDAKEMVALAPDIIVATTTAVLSTVVELTKTIPVVFVGVSDPVAQGFVRNLAHPGGHITGFAGFEFSIGGKWLDLLKQFAPNLKRVALMGNPVTSPQFKHNLASVEAAGATFGIDVIGAPVTDKAGIESTVASLAAQGGLIIANDNFLRTRHLADILASAAHHRVPAIYSQRAFVDAGGLMRYGSISVEQWRGVAYYVDRILKGAKAGELPVQQATRYELIINLKSARALGLDVPMGLMMRADEVIE